MIMFGLTKKEYFELRDVFVCGGSEFLYDFSMKHLLFQEFAD